MRKIFLSLLFFEIIVSNCLYAHQSLKNIRMIIAENEHIGLKVNLIDNTLTITKLNISDEIPLGKLTLLFQKELSVNITKKKIGYNEHEKAIIIGTDYHDGIGTTIEVSFFLDQKTATIAIESQFEEINLRFIPQLVPIQLIQ